jgi:RHS repeat-associated protein
LLSKSQSKEFWRYAWDYENRMMTASTRKQTVRYRYDALGRRIQRYLVGGKENTKFIYDGMDVVADENSGILTKYQNGLGIDNKIKMVTGSTTQYFLADHLGSTVGLTDASGNLSSSANYDSFGNSSNNLTTRYQYTGREFDNFTGLQYSRARWYDANLGRFISEDPIGFESGAKNFYEYVGNHPITAKDPFGLQANQTSDCDTEKSCAKDRLEMWSAMYELTQKWNQEDKRHSFYIYNGISGTVGIAQRLIGEGANYIYPTNIGNYFANARIYMPCTDQANGLRDRLFELRNSGKFENGWTFNLEYLHYSPFGPLHTRLRATSANPKCGSFWLDPWKDSIERF